MSLRVATFVILAFLCTSVVYSQVTKSNEDAVIDAINELGSAGDDRIEEIQQGLFAMGDDALAYLIHALELSPDPKVRYQVALILGNMRSDKAVRPLFLASQLDRSRTVREGARLALENLVMELSERRMTDTTFREYRDVTRSMALSMKKTLKSDRDPLRRINAAKALGRFGKKSDIDDILKIVLDEKTPEVRQAMLRAAERLAYPEMLEGNYRIVHYRRTTTGRGRFRMRLVDRLLHIIENDTSMNVKQTAVNSLTRLVYPIFVLGEGRLSSLPHFTDEHKSIIERVTRKFLDMALEHDYRMMRPLLIQSSTKLLNAYFRRGDTSLDDELRRRLTTEVYDFSGDYSYKFLPYTIRVSYEKNFTYTPLKQSALADRAREVFEYIFLNDKSAENRRLAATAFSTLGRKSDAGDIIRGLMREKDFDVWLAAVDALGRIDNQSSAKWLYEVVRDGNAADAVRVQAILSIGLINNREVTRLLVNYYPHAENIEIRKAIVEAMRFTKDEYTARFLVNALDEEVSEIRRAAVYSLAENTYRAAVPKLEKLMRQDPSPKVRAAAIMSLNRNDPKNSFKSIINALSDKSAIVRCAAAVELGIMGDEKAVGSLAKVMREDSDEDVRVEAARSLAYVGNQYAVQPLVDTIIDDASEAVRDEAQRSLILIDKPRMGIVAIKSALPELQRKNPEAVARLREAHYYLRLQFEGYLKTH